MPGAEAAFQYQVIDVAHLYGWRVAHFRPAQDSHGRWRTAVQGDGKGFPDLLLVRERVIAAELKSDDGTLSVDQMLWLSAFEAAGIETHVWRPADLPNLPAVLGPGRPA